MADFDKIYTITNNLFESNDVAPITSKNSKIDFILEVWSTSRMWIEARYMVDTIRPIANIKTIVPEGPNDPNILIDACITFAPIYFKDCLSLQSVEDELNKSKVIKLDFDLNNNIPLNWSNLREEAKPIFDKLRIYEGKMHRISKTSFY